MPRRESETQGKMPSLTPAPPQMKKPSGTAPRPHPCPLFNEAQNWLQIRFDGLQPQDLFGNLPYAIYSAMGLVAPPSFHDAWRNIDTHHRAGGVVPEDERVLLSSASVILVLGDLNHDAHAQDVNHLARFIQQHCDPNRPRVILLQHSVQPYRRSVIDESRQVQVLVDASQPDNDVIVDDLVGLKLAWAVQNRLLRQNVRTSNLQKRIRVKQTMLQKADEIDCCMDYTFWVYLRERLNTRLPPMDPNLGPGRLHAINSFQIGDLLGRGTFGSVYKLMRDGSATGQVVKTIAKHRITTIQDMAHLSLQIKVMQLVSSESYPHPHLIQLLGIHHSETHIFFRLEDGGSRDLYKRLRHRDNRHSPLSCLSSRKVESILSQVSSAMCHLHTVPEIVHFDIKPENIIVSETAEDVHVYITDFDKAVVQPPLWHGVRGTFPFLAPEQFQEDAYDPFAADVWSMAVVFLELVCHLHVLEKALRLHRLPDGVPRDLATLHQKEMAATIRHFFSQEDATCKLLNLFLHPTLREIDESLLLILPKMLTVIASSRATSTQVAQAFCLERQLRVAD